MATYDLEEQEQLASLQAWWKQHGGLIVAVIVIASLIFTAWNIWNWYQRSQSANAAAVYSQLQNAARANDIKATKDAAGTILEQHPRTIYAPLAALLSAKVHFESGDLKTARAQLQWAVDNARSAEMKSLATLRLATVLIDDNAAADAAKLMEAKPEKGFEGLYAATRGDALLALNKTVDAKAAYKAALDNESGLDPAMKELVQVKLGALGGST
jgi:predicted negative regulator of RcsB-dependent stress response